MASDYARDVIGYGGKPPHPRWPKQARLAVNFVLNYEEGSEPSIVDGDNRSEAHAEGAVVQFGPGERDLAAESSFEYGSRAGFWRITQLFDERKIPLDGVRLRARARTQSAGRPRDRGAWLRHLLSRLALGADVPSPRGRGAQAHPARRRLA